MFWLPILGRIPSQTRLVQLPFWEVTEFRKILSAPKVITKSSGTMTPCLFGKRGSMLTGSLLDLLEKNSTQNQPASQLQHRHRKIKALPPKIPWIYPTPQPRAELGRRSFYSKFISGWMFWWTCLLYNKYFPPKIMELSVSFQALSSPQAPARAMVF